MKWQYDIKSYTKNASGLQELNDDGAKGWEVVFIIAETSTHYKTLLKRRYE